MNLTKTKIFILHTEKKNEGELFFTNLNNIASMIDSVNNATYITEVIILDDSNIYFENETRFIADKLKIALNYKVEIKKFSYWSDINFCINAVKQNGMVLQYISKQTPQIITLAIKQNCYSLKFVKTQTIEICKTAIDLSPSAIMYVENKFLTELIQYCGMSIGYITQNNELCKLAVQQNGLALCHINKQTKEICKLAVQQNKKAILYVKNDFMFLFDTNYDKLTYHENVPKNTKKNYTGKEFNGNYNQKFYKILNSNMEHYDHTYINGVNINNSGLYFTELNKLAIWLNHNPNLTYIVSVEIPNDANVCVEKNKFKTNKIIVDLDTKCKIKDFELFNDVDFCFMCVKQNGLVLKYVKPEIVTYEMCKTAVQQNGMALRYVKAKFYTNEICEMAIKQEGLSLACVKPEFCTNEMCLSAVRQNGLALIFVKEQNFEIVTLAVKQNPLIFRYIEDIWQTEEIVEIAVKHDGLNLMIVKNQNDNICKLAIKQNIQASNYVKKWSHELKTFFSDQTNKLIF